MSSSLQSNPKPYCDTILSLVAQLKLVKDDYDFLFSKLTALNNLPTPSVDKQQLYTQYLSKKAELESLLTSIEIRQFCHEIYQTSDTFFRSHNLSFLADTLPQDFTLTPEQITKYIEFEQKGYTRITIIPRGIDNYLPDLIKNLTDGLGKDDQGKPIPTWLSDTVKASFPNNIKTVSLQDPTTPDPNRSREYYLLLTNPSLSLLPGSKGKSPDIIIPELESLGLTGLTLAEYLIEERMHFDETGKHLVDWANSDWTWLLNSRDKDGRVLDANWDPEDRLVQVSADSSSYSNPVVGVRPSIVL